MGANNYGNANITFRYKHPAKAENFNSVLRGVCPSGIYKGGTVSYIGNILTLAPYTAIFESSNDKATTITTTSSIDLSTVTTFGGNASSATPYVIMRYTYSNVISNYPDYYQVAFEDIQSTDIIICKVLFDGGGVVNGIDYSEAHTAPQYNKDLNTFNIACDTFIKNKKINKDITTGIDVNTTTNELICNTSLFFTPTADRTLDITAGAHFADIDLYIYNNSDTYKVTLTYYMSNTFDVLPNGYVALRWNGTRWIIFDSSEMKKEIIRELDANYTASKFENNTDLFFVPTADRTINLTAGARFVGCEVLISNDASSTYKLTVSFGGVETIDIHFECKVKFTYSSTGWTYEVLTDFSRETETIIKGTFLGYQKYRKVVNFGALPNAGQKEVAHGIQTPYTIVSISGIAFDGNTDLTLPHTNYGSTAYSIYVFIRHTDHKVAVGTGT
ncbi:MAG TPA: hypothetical protein PLU55_01640, partial [Candidatus Pacearchaeota archaeon]|nr:hypothetical protein [Candidatus Pacearchaeota archaeon]